MYGENYEEIPADNPTDMTYMYAEVPSFSFACRGHTAVKPRLGSRYPNFGRVIFPLDLSINMWP